MRRATHFAENKTLTGSGVPIAGRDVMLDVTEARPFANATLVVGGSAGYAPFKGGVFVPSPLFLVPGLALDGAGTLTLPDVWPAGIPSDFTTYMQVWLSDPTGPKGFTSTNGLSVTTP